MVPGLHFGKCNDHSLVWLRLRRLNLGRIYATIFKLSKAHGNYSLFFFLSFGNEYDNFQSDKIRGIHSFHLCFHVRKFKYFNRIVYSIYLEGAGAA
jgi:hypothetical protein